MIARIHLRLLAAIPIALAVSALVFFLVEASPGDPSLLLLDPNASPHANDAQRAILGLDRPVAERFGIWMRNTLTLDFGRSFVDQVPVRDKIAAALPSTLLLSSVSLAIAFGLGLAAALASASRPRSALDHVLSAIALVLQSTPIFWLAWMAIAWLAVGWGWFPTGGTVSLTSTLEPGLHLLDRLHHLALPALVLGVAFAGEVSRFARGALVDTLEEDFVRASRARGASRRRALLRHAFPASLHSTISLLGLSIPYLVGGAVLVEEIFDWPGMGRLLVGAMVAKDYPVVAAGVVALATLAVVGNLLADLLAARLDPRVGVP
ncbi:MAG TPA: ABC transporter permease [Planctomycetota bacterium]|nr:ABC transporter permease [Planctomycetota bacterium]